MAVIEAYEHKYIKPKRDRLNLDIGTRVRNIRLLDAEDGNSRYGPYTMLGVVDNKGVEYNMLLHDKTNFGMSAIETFTSTYLGNRSIRGNFTNKEIWIGKYEVASIRSPGNFEPKMDYGFEEKLKVPANEIGSTVKIW